MATLKQKLIVSKLVENGGNIGKAMVDVGYSPNTAKTPTKLTRSKGWQELMETAFPDEMLIKVHKELLEASSLNYIQLPESEDDNVIKRDLTSISGVKIIDIRTYADSTPSSYYINKYKKVSYIVPLYQIRLRAIEMILKLKNRYPSRRQSIEDNNGQLILKVVTYKPSKRNTP